MSAYDCAEQLDKAEQVARVLLSDRNLIKDPVESYASKSIAVLQAQAYVSKTRLDHLDLDPDLRRQYEVVYPMVIEVLKREFPGLGDNFVDLRTALDRDEYFCIDWCHLSPNGNEMIAQRIGEAVARRQGTPATALR
jgi:hypothetical protein